MRLWSLHPKYLDRQGLLALWRESLLAQQVLLNKTRGYRRHPQLDRFRAQRNPLAALSFYLRHICNEAESRGYNFQRCKIGLYRGKVTLINVKRGQVYFEFKHLLSKLKKRDKLFYKKYIKDKRIAAHPLFEPVKGGIERWEKV